NLRRYERLLTLDRRLRAVLTRKEKPRSPAEGLEFANLCYYRRYYVAGASLAADAFSAAPDLADDLKAKSRYNAACAAPLPAAAESGDATAIAVEEWAWLQLHALEWLRADLAAYARVAEKGGQDARAVIGQQLAHWQADADLAAVRDPNWLANM